MAAATVTRTETHSMGDLTMLIVVMSSVADTNTHDTGISDGSVVAWWAQAEENETAGEEGVNVSESAGIFTFGLKTTGAVKLFILRTGA